ncbi:MAG: hypothetical protein IJ785_03710 [Bacteroidales bacterium]|nr:hypothetical protein [Bacteroidales bacterium]
MKRLITPLLLTVIFILTTTLTPATAQTDNRTWDQGPLTWDDFTLMPAAGAEPSLLQYELGYAPVHDTIDNILSHYYLATARMLPGSSWVSANHRTPELLRYHQVVFDMLEVERRTLQHALNAADEPRAFQSMLYAASDRLNTRIASFRSRTQDGADTTDLAAFEQQVRHELALLPATYQPSYTPHPFGYSAYFSLGAAFPFGTMGQDFTPGFTIGYGFDFSWRRHFFNAEAYMGGLDARKQLAFYGTHNVLPAPYNFVKGQAYNHTVINFGYGYLLLDDTRMQLAPIAALSLHELSTLRNYTDHFTYTRLEPAVGLMFRYHFWQQNSFPHYSALFGSKRISERNRISLHSKVMLSYSSFPRIEGSPTGLNLLAQVGIAFGGRYLIAE